MKVTIRLLGNDLYEQRQRPIRAFVSNGNSRDFQQPPGVGKPRSRGVHVLGQDPLVGLPTDFQQHPLFGKGHWTLVTRLSFC